MNNIQCTYCRKPITSKEDILLGTHYSSSATLYHVNCFDEAKKSTTFFRKPVRKILPNQINFFLGVNILNIVIGCIIIIIGILTFSFPKPQPIFIILGLFCLLFGLTYAATLLKNKKLIEKFN